MCKGADIPSDMKCFAYIPQLEADAAEWYPNGLKADYCLAEHFDQRCSVNANLPIIIVVICCNAVKLAIMLMVAFRLRGRPLITMGDAIGSFLDRPDATTLDMCLLSKDDVVKRKPSVGVDGGIAECGDRARAGLPGNGDQRAAERGAVGAVAARLRQGGGQDAHLGLASLGSARSEHANRGGHTGS